ncbi:hypothetical protein NOVOSPHI9U_260171 [Novosphingobium sp. 9U]|nr:hypothetical protein NOVOSPHI9U_260171 [Novosphingobium sp. 9U]
MTTGSGKARQVKERATFVATIVGMRLTLTVLGVKSAASVDLATQTIDLTSARSRYCPTVPCPVPRQTLDAAATETLPFALTGLTCLQSS